MEYRTLGKTLMKVSRIGYGSARIGSKQIAPDQVEAALNTALDLGINFVDTAACYHDSEALIGTLIGRRRAEFILASKCGHVTGGASGEAWSGSTISQSVDRSLRRLKTDYLDLLQLHSCSKAVLLKGEAVEAILRLKAEGKTRHVGYSGDGEDAIEAIRTGVFETLQTSFNLVDLSAKEEVLPAAREAGLGVIAKRPIANGAFGRSSSPYKYADLYWERAKQLNPPEAAPEDPLELSLRFTLSQEAIDTAIVGTTNAEHVRGNLDLAEKGRLPVSVVESFYEQFDRLGTNWKPQI